MFQVTVLYCAISITFAKPTLKRSGHGDVNMMVRNAYDLDKLSSIIFMKFLLLTPGGACSSAMTSLSD